MGTATQAPPTSSPDAADDAVTGIAGALLGAVGVLLVLPLAVPWLAVQFAGYRLAKRHRFWITYRWQWVINVVGVLVVLGVLAWEVTLVAQWVNAGGLQQFADAPSRWLLAWNTVWPWLIVNALLGVLLLPIAWSLRRRQIADQVRERTIPDVVTQERVESARKRAADIVSARRLGLRLDPRTGQLSPTAGGATVGAPLAVRDRIAFGILTRHTVRTVRDRLVDERRVPDWVDDSGRYLVLPRSAGATRGYLAAESGAGKTVLLQGLILSALEAGWPVFFLDAKGDPADADELAAAARAGGRTVRVGEAWNLFRGGAEQITSKLMRLMPSPDGANQYYLDEIRGVLQALQYTGPFTGMNDLFGRLTAPAEYVRDQVDLQMLTEPLDREGTTRAVRVRTALLVALRPLEPFLASSGWSYGDGGADLTVVSLSPIEDAQARLGDLMLMDLRGYLADRLASRDKTPLLVVVDEFPQLVTSTSDPGDTAGALFETSRSAGAGLILAGQSATGLSHDETRRRRALSSGAALLFGRSKDPEDIVKYAGTVMRMESSAAAAEGELKSGRAQHTFLIPPQDVREAPPGSFWIVQGGGMAHFRALLAATSDH